MTYNHTRARRRSPRSAPKTSPEAQALLAKYQAAALSGSGLAPAREPRPILHLRGAQADD